jgi:spore maturation protein A
MKVLTGFMRYLLNINTVWGLMILASFLLCLVQHVQATTTVLPAARLAEGPNTVAICMVDDAGDGEAVQRFDYTLTRSGEMLAIADADTEQRKDRPWLIAARIDGDSARLTWDAAGHGHFMVGVGGDIIASGQLVTLESISDAAMKYAQSGFHIALGLVATMVLFLGLMRVGQDAGIIQLVARVFYPVIRFLFPEVPKEHPANGAILMNFTTTLLGLGNAATPFGLKAMKELQSLNDTPEVATDSQIMFLGYNTAGLAILPTTLLAMRKAAGCSDPFEVIGTCMLAGATATLTAIITCKLLTRLPMFSRKVALAEYARDQASSEADSTEVPG